MTIIYDLEIKYPNFKSKLSITQIEVLFELRSFVEENLTPLKEEIENEESNAPKGKKCATVIALLEKKIQPFRYSDTLHNKIVALLNKADFNDLWLRIESIIQQWNN